MAKISQEKLSTVAQKTARHENPDAQVVETASALLWRFVSRFCHLKRLYRPRSRGGRSQQELKENKRQDRAPSKAAVI